MENGYRKSQDSLANKVCVKVENYYYTVRKYLFFVLQEITFCAFITASKSQLHL